MVALVRTLVVLTMASGCVAVQTRTSVDVVIDTDDAGGHEHVTYEATEAHTTVGLALACFVTGVFYGGACWAYLAAPFDDQEQAALLAAEREVRSLGDCAHIIRTRVEGIGYLPVPRRVAIANQRGQLLSLVEAQRTLCARLARSRSGAAPPRAPPPAPAGPLDPSDAAPAPASSGAPTRDPAEP